MPAALLLLAASEPSKVPFYLVGGLLAAWAVVLALIGLSRPDFPGSVMRARGVMLISALLVAGTVSSAIATASKPSATKGAEAPAKGPAGPAGGTVQVKADPSGVLRYDTTAVQAKAGTVTISFDNPSTTQHNVTVEGAGKKIGGTPTIAKSAATARLDLKPGTYTFYCSVDAHRQAGMQGKLTVAG